MSWRILEGDCVEQMQRMPEASVDAVVCDPPYGLEFMGKEWDRLISKRPSHNDKVAAHRENGRHGGGSDPFVQSRVEQYVGGHRAQQWHQAWATEALRVLKPGGHLLTFGGTRTYHRLACAIEDAGFEIRDTIAWMYGSGFPKSLNLNGDWDGWGTALKPAHEPVVVARKPLAGTVAQTVLKHGTGALNVDGCRVAGDVPQVTQGAEDRVYGGGNGLRSEPMLSNPNPAGRWPANVALDEQAAEMLDEQTGERPSTGTPNRPARPGVTPNGGYGEWAGAGVQGPLYGDSGGASRFFYVAKASSAERNAGLDGFEEREHGAITGADRPHDTLDPLSARFASKQRNVHPTVKPIDLMRWLVRLVTPPGGLVLDPFTGSGTTGCAAMLEKVRFVGIEREAEYAAIARARVAWWAAHPEGVQLVRRLEAEAERRATADRGQLDLFG